MRAPLSETVKLNPAGAEAGVCGSPLEDDEELEENEADFVTDLSTALPLTLCLIFSGSAGLGGMSENESIRGESETSPRKEKSRETRTRLRRERSQPRRYETR